MSGQPKTFLTPEQYLAIERMAETKSEYYNGETFAIAGAREPRNMVITNVNAEFREQFRQRPCRSYSNDMRVRTVGDLYAYPDVIAVCGEPRFLDGTRDTLLNPSVIVEVLSPSTEAYDRGRKFELYQSIDSLKEYLLLASDHLHADLYVRQPSGQWLLTSAGGLEDMIEIQSVDCRLKLADLYEKVDWSEQPPAVLRSTSFEAR